MSHAVKLTFFFVISVALHGAGLWAAAGRFEPREPPPPAEVAIVDRDLFFRHAERSEIRASAPLSATDRLAPLSADAVRPSQPGERVASAPPASASQSQPERHEPESPVSALARLDLPTLDATPPPSRDAAELEPVDAERSEPTRMAGIAAALPRSGVRPRAERAAPAALRPRTSEAALANPADAASLAVAPSLQAASDATRAARTRATEPEARPLEEQTLAPAAEPQPAPVNTQLHARAAEPLARTAADTAMRTRLDVVARAEPVPAPSPAPAHGAADPARPLAPADAARAPSPVTTAPAAPPAPAGARSDIDVLASADAARAPSPLTTAPAAPAAPAGARSDIDVLARAEAARAPSPVITALAAPLAPAGARGAVDVLASAEANPARSPELARNAAEAAPPVTAAETPRARVSRTPASGGAPAREAVRGSITIGVRRPADAPAAPELARGETAEAQSMAAAEPARASRDRPSLRGTLPAPLVDPRQPRHAEAPEAPASAPRQASRLRPSLPGEPDRPRPSAPAQTETARPAERAALAPADTADASRDLAALAPETPTRRLQQSDEPPAGRDDPADQFTRRYEGGDCFFPLRVAARDGAAIRGYGLQADSVDMFRQAFAQALGTEPNVRWRPLTDAQCAGISFTRLILGDAAPSVQISLDHKELGLGRDLAGTVTGSRFDFVTLLLVDDSGVVHNVLDYLRSDTADDPADLAFAIPVQPVDDGTDRVQLIMAVGASHRLPALETTLPVHSDDFFPELLAQTREAGATLELGLEDFVILGDGN